MGERRREEMIGCDNWPESAIRWISRSELIEEPHVHTHVKRKSGEDRIRQTNLS